MGYDTYMSERGPRLFGEAGSQASGASKAYYVEVEGEEKEVWLGVEIEGSREFIEATRDALDAINKTRSFAQVRRYVGRIKQFDRSGMNVYMDKPTFEVASPWQESMAWYGSTIVHDAMHAKLYEDSKQSHGGAEPPADAWTGADAERTCLKIQRETLEEIGGEDDDLRMIDLYMENPTYQGDGSHEDYLNRDW